MSASSERGCDLRDIEITVTSEAHLELVRPCLIEKDSRLRPLGIAHLSDDPVKISLVGPFRLHVLLRHTGHDHLPVKAQPAFAECLPEHPLLSEASHIKALVDDL